jgi:hypothetical protein
MYQHPTIYNLAMAANGTEYSQALPEDTRKVLIRSRLNAEIKLAYSSEGDYITIPAGAAKSIEGVYLKDITLYLISGADNDVAEIEVFK